MTTKNETSNASNDDATTQNDASTNDTTTTHRATTRALTNVKLTKTQNERVLRVNDRNVKIVRTSNDTLRIDHSLCSHDKNRNAREKCRREIERANAKK